MTASTPTSEPLLLRAGDSWKWRREDLTADYPASSWTLTYRFRNASGGFEIVADADGDAFEVTVTPASNSDYAAGTYGWAAQVSMGSEAHTVASGTVKVLPNLFAAGEDDTALDLRSHARKVLDAIEAVLEKRATLDQQRFLISANGSTRELWRTPIPELTVLRDRYAAMVASEEAAERVGRGLGSKNKLFVRF